MPYTGSEAGNRPRLGADVNDFYFPQPFGQYGQYGQYGQTPQPQRREVLFVNDAASAGRLPLLPGESALALSYTDDVLYFVQADAAGSVAVREFEYRPRDGGGDGAGYVTRADVEEIVSEALGRLVDEHDKADAAAGGQGQQAAAGRRSR